MDLRVSKGPVLEFVGSMESEGMGQSPKPLEQDTMRGKTAFPFMELLAVVLTRTAVG